MFVFKLKAPFKGHVFQRRQRKLKHDVNPERIQCICIHFENLFTEAEMITLKTIRLSKMVPLIALKMLTLQTTSSGHIHNRFESYKLDDILKKNL